MNEIIVDSSLHKHDNETCLSKDNFIFQHVTPNVPSVLVPAPTARNVNMGITCLDLSVQVNTSSLLKQKKECLKCLNERETKYYPVNMLIQPHSI